MHLPNFTLLQQVCPELNNEAVDYDEPSGDAPDDGEALCMILAVDTQTSQQQMVPLKEALLEVRFFFALPCPFQPLTLCSLQDVLPCKHVLPSHQIREAGQSDMMGSQMPYRRMYCS